MTYSFTPTETGRYMFYSYHHDFDTYGSIKDAEGNTLESDDDLGKDKTSW